MKESVTIKVKKGDSFLYSPIRKEYLLVHPLLSAIINKNTISNKYFSKKYLFLKKHNYLKGIDQKSFINSIFTKENIIDSVSKHGDITFEVTENCNLKCDYCCYREMYTGYDFRSGENITFKYAKKVIDKVVDIIVENNYKRKYRKLSIGFYGGEPLLNFNFIKEVVKYAKTLQDKITISFRMTTNTTLIHKYINFLAENDFSILISLDGDLQNNAYRKYHNDKPSFHKVFENINYINENYPDFFLKKISFNVVYHDLNSNLDELFDFFIKNFSKYPLLAQISTDNVQKEKEVLKKSVDYNLSLKKSKYFNYFKEKRLMNIPEFLDFNTVLKQTNIYHYKDYRNLLFYNVVGKLHTGTCIPFSRRIFVTAKGKILPCENVVHKHSLGIVNNDAFDFEWEAILDYYKKLYVNYEKQCMTCYKADICDACLIAEDNSLKKTEKFKCSSFSNKKAFSQTLADAISLYNEEPRLYKTHYTE